MPQLEVTKKYKKTNVSCTNGKVGWDFLPQPGAASKHDQAWGFLFICVSCQSAMGLLTLDSWLTVVLGTISQ